MISYDNLKDLVPFEDLVEYLKASDDEKIELYSNRRASFLECYEPEDGAECDDIQGLADLDYIFENPEECLGIYIAEAQALLELNTVSSERRAEFVHLDEKLAACAIVAKDGKFLSISRRNDSTKWGLPGGKVDPGETLEDAIKREFLEEVGVQIHSLRRIGTFPCVGETTYMTTTFFGKIDTEDFVPEEGMELRWLTASELCSSMSPFAMYNMLILEAFQKQTYDGVLKVTRSVISDILGIDDNFSDEISIVALGADDLDQVEILMGIEDSFSDPGANFFLQIPDEKISGSFGANDIAAVAYQELMKLNRVM